MGSARSLQRAMMLSKNRHWFGRFVISAWALLVVLFAFAEPNSLAADAMYAAGPTAYVFMAILGLLSLGLLLDSAMHDIFPGALQQLLMVNRHMATMMMAMVLVLEGGGLASYSKSPLLVAPFLVLAVFCGLVTYLDLHATNKERRG